MTTYTHSDDCDEFDPIYGEWTPAPRYEILSSARDDPADVIEWGLTDTYWKAEWIFLLVKTHAERLGLGVVGLRDRDRQESRLIYRVGEP